MISAIKYGFEESDIDNIISIFKQNPKISKAVLFGSRAKGNFRNGSDVDIALFGNNLCLDDLLEAYGSIEYFNLPYKFDLVIYDRISEQSLKEHIDRVGIILYTQH
jgi:Predicted nucleotidyltransferases